MILACSLWIASGWADGASAVTLAAVACCFFAALDEPAPMVFRFFVATAISVLAAGVYLFAVLPHVHDFPMLVILFAAPFYSGRHADSAPAVQYGHGARRREHGHVYQHSGRVRRQLSDLPQQQPRRPRGLLYAYLWTRVTRPFGAELAAARLLRSSWSDVALTASTRPIEDPRNHAARMLDRLMQLIPRLAATDDHRHPSIESFRDLRIAFNSLDLRRLARKLGGEAPAAIEQVLDGVRGYYESCANRHAREPVPASLMSSIDSAVARVTAQDSRMQARTTRPRKLRHVTCATRCTR